jgi:hypothetical protein
MAEHGFESNDDYEFQVRCLLESPARGLRTLNIEGDSERRKTAFANALARALDFPRCLYHDFTELHPPQPDLILPPSRDELGRAEPPIEPLDQTVSEACAQSEGEPLFEGLGTLFRTFGTAPTRSELANILHDLQLHVRTPEHLRLCLYGRSEGLGREALADSALAQPLAAVVAAAQAWLVGEHIELRGD